MNFKRAKVEDKMVNVVDIEELQTNRELYNTGNIAVEIERSEGDTFVLPYRPNVNVKAKNNKPGVYQLEGVGDFIVYPDSNDVEEYKPEVIDLTSSKSMQEYIEKQGRLRNMEKELLISPDNIFTPQITDEDTPLMKGLKKAVIEKHIDIDKYADGYGENFPNDKRKFKDHDISIKLFERHIDVLGIKAVLVLSDSSPDIPNPIGKSIYIPLNYNEGGNDGEDYPE